MTTSVKELPRRAVADHPVAPSDGDTCNEGATSAPFEPDSRPALDQRRSVAGRRVAGAVLSLAGLLAVTFVIFQLGITPIVAARFQRVLAGELTQRIETAAALASGGATGASVGGSGLTGLGELEGGAVDSDRSVIPDLRGEVAADAVQVLENLGFRVRRTSEPSRSLIPGLVTRTVPAANQRLAAGEEVTVVVATLAPGSPIATLTAERIGLSQIVVEGTSSDQLRAGPGHYRDSALPGQAGNAVIFGRRTTYGGPFRRINELEPGDMIKVATLNAEVSYRVNEVRVVNEGEPDVLGQDGRNLLTLVTSSPALYGSDRLAVISELVDEPVGGSAIRSDDVGRAITLAAGEDGRSRDPMAWAPTLLWLEILVAGVLVTGHLRRRWSPTTTWLVMAPTLTMAAVLLFESTDRLFPSTF